MTRSALLFSALLLVACSSAQDGARQTVTPTIMLTNTTPNASSAPSGPFVSVVDSLELRVMPENGPPVTLGRRLSRYSSTTTLQPSFPPGNTLFIADIFSNAKVVVFTGGATQLITSNVLSLPLQVTATRPVLLVAPDTAKTNTVTSTQFSVYNAGIGTLQWNIISTDTAFTRCGGQCSLAPTSGSVAPGATTAVRMSVPTNFPSRLFSFVVRSAEGNVTAAWQYTGSAITSVAVQPTASLHGIGQAFPLTSSVQATGTASTAVSWSSSSNAVATVSPSGVVTGVSPRVATVTATSVVDTSKKASADIRVYDSTAVNTAWAIVQPAGPDTVRRDDTSPGARSTIVLTAQASGTIPPTFTSVEFWVRPGSIGPWRRIGQSSTRIDGTDSSGAPAWSWSYTWNPDATDAPFTNPSTIGMSVLAIGITTGGLTTATPVSPNLFVRVP